MNSRILELAKDSDLIRYESDGNIGRVEEFANRIIQECISIVENLPAGYEDYRDQIENSFRNSCKQAIKQHFGMEIELEENWDHYSGLPSPNAYQDD